MKFVKYYTLCALSPHTGIHIYSIYKNATHGRVRQYACSLTHIHVLMLSLSQKCLVRQQLLFYEVRQQHIFLHRVILLPNSMRNCNTMLGLYLHAKLASSRHDPKEKWGEIRRQNIDGHRSHIVHIGHMYCLYNTVC